MPHRCRFEVVAITTCAESQPIRSPRHAISARFTMSRRAIGSAPFRPIEMLTYEVADETVYTTAARDECGGNRKVGKGSQLSHIFKASRNGDAVAVVVSVNVADQRRISGSKRRLWMEELRSFTQADSGGS